MRGDAPPFFRWFSPAALCRRAFVLLPSTIEYSKGFLMDSTQGTYLARSWSPHFSCSKGYCGFGIIAMLENAFPAKALETRIIFSFNAWVQTCIHGATCKCHLPHSFVLMQPPFSVLPLPTSPVSTLQSLCWSWPVPHHTCWTQSDPNKFILGSYDHRMYCQ